MLRARTRVVFWDEDDLARELERSDAGEPVDSRLSSLRDEKAAREKVLAALGKIHPRYANAIRIRLIEEQPREDAARLLEVTPATFDVLLHRALTALKKHLAAEERATR